MGVRTMRVLVAERKPHGHRLSYVRLLLEAGIERGWTMSLLMPNDRVADDEVEFFLRGDFLVQTTARVTSTREWVRAVESASRESHSDVVVPDGDHFLAAVGVRGSWQGGAGLVGLVLRDPTVYRMSTPQGRLAAATKKALIHRAAGARGVTPLRLSGQAKPPGDGWVRDPIRFSPDSASVRELRAEFGDQQWLGILGRIDQRKSVAEVADAAALVSKATRPVGLLLRGRCEPRALADAEPAFERLRQAGGRIIIDDRLCSDVELDSTVAAVDCLIVAHTNEGPSGILGKGLASGTRVVVAGARSLKPDVSLSRAGLWSELDPRAMSAGIMEVLGLPRPDPVPVADATEFCADLLGPLAGRPRE